MPIAEWPASDQAAWTRAHRSGGHLDDEDGLAARWSPATDRKISKGWGAYLWYLLTSTQLDPATGPEDRVTRELILGYVDDLRRRGAASGTVWARVQEVSRAVGVMVPGFDRGWLLKLLARLRTMRRPVRDDRARLVPAAQLWRLAEELMARGEAGADHHSRDHAAEFRDGLMLAIALVTHLRVKNIASMRLNTHLRLEGDSWWVVFSATEMKQRRPYERPLPAIFNAWIDRYLTHHRQKLLRRPTGRIDLPEGPFLITERATAFRENGINYRTNAVTGREVGKAMNPHLVRKLVPTEAALQDPEHVGIAQVLLGHAVYDVTQEAYNLARSMDASQKLNATLGKIKADACRPAPTGRKKKAS